jgi:hypothetical protein
MVGMGHFEFPPVPRLCLRCRRLGARPWEWSGRVAPGGRPGWSKVRYWLTQLLLGVAELVLGVWAVRSWQRSLFTLVTLVGRGLSGRWRGRSSHRGPPSALARDLPETALRATSRRLMSPLSTVPLTWAVVWTRRVLHGSVNRPRIDGKDGVGGSIPPGGLHTGSDQRLRWSVPRLGPVEWATLVVLGSGVVLDRRVPDGEHFPG